MTPLYRIIGFSPSWPQDLGDPEALTAFAYRQGRVPFEPSVTPEDAERLLSQYPQIATRFAEVFPWLSQFASVPTGAVQPPEVDSQKSGN